MSKLERIRNMINRNLVKHRFYQWHANSMVLMNLEDAIFKTSKTIQRRRLRNAFNKYKKKVGEIKRAEHIATKEKWFASIRNRHSIDECFSTWKEYIKQYKLAKKFLIRSIKGVDKSLMNDAIEKWKKIVFE